MSMSTIYVAIHPDGTVYVSPHLNAEETVRWASTYGITGELYACLISDQAAFEVSEATRQKPSINATPALSLLKRYSHSMMKCADLT